MFRVKTEFPVALDSPDHIVPWGTKNDNHSNSNFIDEVEAHFVKKINFMDIGCSGGALVHDFLKRGHNAIGIEGSDFSLKHNRAEWEFLANTNLFTCDASRPYTITDENDKQIKFDFITAWEVIEHIHPDRLNQFFQNISDHLTEDGFFVGSVSTKAEIIEGVTLHQSVYDEWHWKNQILNQVMDCFDYPFVHKVRNDMGSFWIKLQRKK